MTDSTNICLPCGLCCDGTLIGFVQLDAKEVPALKEVMEIEDENDLNVFLQPCDSFCKSCTIYSKRPQSCDDFNCQLFHSVNNEQLEYVAAINIIEEVKQRKKSIQQDLNQLQFNLKSKSFYFQIVEVKKRLLKLESTFSITKTEAILSAKIKAFDELISNHFGITMD